MARTDWNRMVSGKSLITEKIYEERDIFLKGLQLKIYQTFLMQDGKKAWIIKIPILWELRKKSL